MIAGGQMLGVPGLAANAHSRQASLSYLRKQRTAVRHGQTIGVAVSSTPLLVADKSLALRTTRSVSDQPLRVQTDLQGRRDEAAVGIDVPTATVKGRRRH
ncbi:hypothetical protein GCM10023075_36140 [Streptosporangium album]